MFVFDKKNIKLWNSLSCLDQFAAPNIKYTECVSPMPTTIGGVSSKCVRTP